MAPRSAKTKKAADVKVAVTEAPKRGRGKAKLIEEAEPEAIDSEVNEIVVTEKKTKRGKKAASDEQLNGDNNEKAPPAKKGKKKNVEEPISDDKPINGDEAKDESSNHNEETEKIEEKVESHDDADEKKSVPSGRGRKKQTKKETEKTSSNETKSGRGKKTTKKNEEEITETEVEKDDIIEEKVTEEKPKSAGKGRGRKAQPKVETEVEEPKEEAIKEQPATKGKKKGLAKKEKSPEHENYDLEEEQKESNDKPAEEPKKKEPKGKKNQGKKVKAKDEELDEEVKEEDEKEEALSKKRKGNKKDDKVELNEDAEDEVPEAKPVKGKRAPKKVVETATETEEEPQDTGEPTTKRRRKVAEEKEDTKKKAPPKNKTTTEYEDLDFANNSKSPQSKNWNFKIASWNVNGIRAWLSKGGLDYIKHEKPDILCMQEVRCAQDKLPEELTNLPGYHAYWLCGEKDGYAGVGIYTTKLAMNVQYGLQNEELDSDGRIITAEYEQFYLITTYVPNAGRKLVTLPKRLQWNTEFRKYVKELDKKKPVIICGDMNVSHQEIDLANPKTNKKNAGFTDEERAGMTELLGDGFIDTYRHLNPDKTGAYTFWTQMMNCRAKNVGWRLDYFILSERLLPSLCDSVIRDKVFGSDHCPISLFLHLSSADKPKE